MQLLHSPVSLCSCQFSAACNRSTACAPEGIQNQTISYSNNAIHDRYYQNQTVNADIMAAFLNALSDPATMKLMGHASLTRDPSAPCKSSSLQCNEARKDIDVVSSKKRLQQASQVLRERHGMMAAARRQAKEDPEIATEVRAFDRLRRQYDGFTSKKYLIS